MAAQVTYTPPREDPAVGSALRAFEQTDSMMKRATQMRWMEEDRRRQQAEFIAMQPVLRAKREADIALAQATVTNAAEIERFRGMYAGAAPTAQKEFQAAMMLPDYKQQAAALADLQQKYAWMKLAGADGAAFVERLENERLFTSQSALADDELKRRLDTEARAREHAFDLERFRQGELNTRNESTNRTSLERARILAGSREDLAKLRDPGARGRRYLQEAEELEAAGEFEEAQFLRDLAKRMSQPRESLGSDDDLFNSFRGGGSPVVPKKTPIPPAESVPTPAPAGANPEFKAPSTQETISKIKHW